MRRVLYLMGVLVAVGAVGTTVHTTFAQSPAAARQMASPVVTSSPTVANVATPVLSAEEQEMLARRFSPERMAAIRARLQGEAQRAVRDDAERAFREPTAAEAAALAQRPTTTGTPVHLANGGTALRAEGENIEFVTATIGDGATVITHDGKGARRDQ